MHINTEKSGVISGIGMNKLKVAVDGDTVEEVNGPDAKRLATEEAGRQGFAGGGFCEVPQAGPVGPDGAMLDGADALDPNLGVRGYRVEFVFAQRA